MAKPEYIKAVTIGDMVAEGKCIVRIDNKVIFVEGAVPGDVADIRIEKNKKRYAEAQVSRIVYPSPHRQRAFCEHFGTCGGCKWQDLDYAVQLQFKQQQVTDALQRLGRLEVNDLRPIIPSDQTTFYRNKLEFTFSNRKWLTRAEIAHNGEVDRSALGFHIPRHFDKVLHINKCWLQPDPSNDIRWEVYEYAMQHKLEFNDLLAIKGFLRNLIVRTASTGQVMVILQVYYYDEQHVPAILQLLKDKFPQITSLNYIVNNKGNETFHDLEVVCWHGLPYIEEEMEGLRFRVGPKSFYQTNSQQAYVLYDVTRKLAALTGQENVYDLYTGTGTIANFVARQARQVVGIEYVPQAIEDARVNSQINGIANTHFYAGDMKLVLNAELIERHGRPDVIITDPPRAGMHPDVVNVLLQAEAQRIVYVSCNPATQARDIALLSEKYELGTVQPVDMFPHTHHVENVALLTLKG